MTFDIITIFPDIFNSYFNESILKRAQDKKLIKINIHNLRDFTKDKHKKIDDSPYGGGPGMVMMIEPIYNAVKKIKSASGGKTKIILLSAKGKKFNQKIAKNFSKLDQIILICGRYEGVDERVAKHIADAEISIGNYVLTGGELPAMVVVDSISRLIPDVINKKSLKQESFSNNLKNKEYPQYTRPEVFKNWKVPDVLISGNHKEIEKWRKRS